MSKVGIGLAVVFAVVLVAFGVVARSARPSVDDGPHLISMTESAGALQQAGAVMQTHGQTMWEDGQRLNDPDLVARGEHWRADGQTLSQRGQWLSMHPLAPSSLVVSPAELSAQGAWGDLPRTAETMLHDPSRARELDLEALRWNGLAMRAEGQAMAEHGRIMDEDLSVMVSRHPVAEPTTANLRQAAEAMRDAGGYLSANGQEMIDYADRLRQSMGYR
jgi:hypothetical protein